MLQRSAARTGNVNASRSSRGGQPEDFGDVRIKLEAKFQTPKLQKSCDIYIWNLYEPGGILATACNSSLGSLGSLGHMEHSTTTLR